MKQLKTLLSLAWPIIVSRSTQVVMGLADAIMIAHLGEVSLAAVTAGALNSVALFILPMGMVFIVSSFSSQLTGRGDPAAARRYGWYGLALAVLAQGVMLLLLPLLPWVLGRIGYAPEVSTAMRAYLSIRLLSTGVVVGMEALGGYYSGTGNTSFQMRAGLSAMLLTVPLNWLLIDGHFGLPAMGVRGAALSNLLATGLSFGGFLAVFVLRGRSLPKGPLRLDEFKRVLRFGLPVGLNWSFEFFAFIAFVNLVVGSLGTTTLAAWMAVMQINSVSFMPAFGLASSGAILVGQAIGAGKKDEVPGLVRLTFLSMASWMGLVALAYLLIPAHLLGPFVPLGSSASFLALGVGMLMLSAAWQLFDAAGITLTEALRAAGDTSFPMWTRALLAWGLFLPGSWITVKVFGGTELEALAWLLAYLSLLSITLYFRFRSGAWRRVQLIEEHLLD
jgi:MATE family multidrug resistance protein